VPRPAIGVIFHPTFPSETLPDYARRAEGAGFDELWLWDDCFLPGALTSAAIALSATHSLKVGIGLMPACAYNPLFAAMEITTLARAFPGRFMPGFGYGVGSWMAQIGAAPKPSIETLGGTVSSIRALLRGDLVTTHTGQVNLESVQMNMTPVVAPPLYIGGIREKTLRLAGRLADGTILTDMSSPAYVRWARKHISDGMSEGGRVDHRVVVFVDVKVNPDGQAARTAARRVLAKQLPWADAHLQAAGLAEAVAAFSQGRDTDQIAAQMPDEWVDTLCAAGTPQQVGTALQAWAAAGADSLVFQPLEGDPTCLDEYAQYLLPGLKWVE
jgi:5,10-methylenetetrahydromethanopterin reductase